MSSSIRPLAKGINATSRSESLRERELSNFAPWPFVLGGHFFANVEAFVQAIKYPEHSAERSKIATMRASMAKQQSPSTAPEFIEWNGRQIPFRSPGHLALQAAGIFAKFDQNKEPLELLLATGNLPITHDLSKPDRPWVERPDTSLPAAAFSQILTETRGFFFGEMGVSDPAMIGDRPVYVTDKLVAYVRAI